MSTRDSHYSHIHFNDSNQVLCMEKWGNYDPIPYDDIDTEVLFEATSNLFPQFLLEEEEDGGIPINPNNFSTKFYKNRRLREDRIWSDLGIFDRFLEENSDLHKQTDKTMLKPIYNRSDDTKFNADNDFTIASCLSNGYEPNDNLDNMISSNDLVNDSIMGHNTSDLSINMNSNSDFIPPNTNFFPITKRNNSNSNITPHGAIAQTPRVGRPRQSSNDYQTPVTRMLRRNFTE